MIEIFTILFPLCLLFTAAAMLVLRAGASRVFFDVVGSFQAERLISDVNAKMTVVQSLILDGMAGIGESASLITDQMQALVDATVPLATEVAEARLEFEKFAAGIEGSKQLRKDIIGMGEAFGFNAIQAQEAGSKMAQLSSLFGGSEAVGAATEAGLAFGMIGGLETEDAMKRIIQLHQQTNALYGDFTQKQFLAMSAEQQANVVRGNSAKLLDELNTIENRSAASMAQITHVMNQFASSGQLAGDSISYMAAASATLIEAGEEQGKAGRALKMMYARLGANTGNNAEVLAQFGVATKGANGELRSMEDVIGDLSAVYPRLTEAQQLQVAQAIAGNDHYVRAIKLIKGHTRTSDLNTMALERLDSAVDETNKKLEDQAYLLKQSEAALFNSKAALGEGLTPAVIQFNNETARMNNALASLIHGDSGFAGLTGAMVSGAYTISNYMRMYAPLGEALLNIMSLNVSLRTQQAIMRGLAQADIVRASAYGGRSAAGATNLMQMHQELALADMLSKLEMKSVDLKRAEIQFGDIKQGKEYAFNAKQMANLRTRLTTNELLHAQEVTASEQINMQLEAGHHKTRAALATSKQKVDTARAELVILNGIDIREETISARLKEDVARGYMMNDGMRQRLTMKEKEAWLLDHNTVKDQYAAAADDAEAIHLAKVLTQEQIINQELAKRPTLKHLINGLGNQEIAALDATIAKQKMVVQGELQHVLAQQASGTAISGLTQAEAILTMMQIQGNDVLTQKVSLSMKQDQLTTIATSAAYALSEAYGIEAAALFQVIIKLPMYNELTNKASQMAQQQYMSQQRLNSVMMGSSMILGAVSMILTMFSDDADTARFAMILMMMSMVPMTIQMMISMNSAVGAAMGFKTLEASMTAAEIAAYRLRTAMITTGIGALAVLIGGALAYLVDWGEETETNTDVMTDFAAAVTYTNEQLQEMQTYYDTMGMIPTLQHQLNLTKDIGDLEEELRLAEQMEQEQTIKYLKDKIKLKREELLATSDIIQLEASANIANMEEVDSKALYENLSSDEMKVSATVAEMVAGWEESDSTWKKRLAKDSDLSDNIYLNLSEDMKGFVFQAAQSSDSYEGFISRVRDFASDYPEMDGFADNLQTSVTGPIEAAKEAAFEFANAREEMFFGMAKGNITGDMVKQVVNKGVETLINTVEVVQTNNFNGMTTKQAADAIVTQIENGLKEKGINLEYA